MTTRTVADTPLPARLEAVRLRIAAAARRSGRRAEDITLIAVSKTQPARIVAQAVEAGATDLGENRIAEAVDKVEELGKARPKPTWHLIGHLQSNKAARAAQSFDVIHSVDSARLMRKLDGAATRHLPMFLQVNISGEASKEGVEPSALPALVEAAQACEHLRLLGLMTIPPLSPDPEDSRPHFRALRDLAERHRLPSLSMGMTNDYEVAIEEGATHVRVGRAIFGERTK